MRDWRLILLFAAMLLGVYGLRVYADATAPANIPSDQPAVRLIIPPTVLPPGPSPTPIACTRNLPNLLVQPVLGTRSEKHSHFFQDVMVVGTGFASGEKLYIVVEGHGTSHGVQTEALDKQVNADGTFTYNDKEV